MWVEIGNDSAIEGYRDPLSENPESVVYRPLGGQRVTRVLFPDGTPLQEAFDSAIRLVRFHMTDPPAWLSSDSESLEALLREHFSISRAKPRAWGKDTGADVLPRMADLMATLMAPALLAAFLLNLRTNGGRDFQANVMGGGQLAGAGTGAMRPADYIGVTADNTAPAAGDTALTGEIMSGSLIRAQAVYAHSNGAASYTLTKTFTSDQPITVAKIGVFNGASGGTMVFETLLNAVATLVSGDQLAITETVTL